MWAFSSLRMALWASTCRLQSHCVPAPWSHGGEPCSRRPPGKCSCWKCLDLHSWTSDRLPSPKLTRYAQWCLNLDSGSRSMKLASTVGKLRPREVKQPTQLASDDLFWSHALVRKSSWYLTAARRQPVTTRAGFLCKCRPQHLTLTWGISHALHNLGLPLRKASFPWTPQGAIEFHRINPENLVVDNGYTWQIT